MDKKRLITLFTLLIALPVVAAITKENLSATLRDLRHGLKRDYQQMAITKTRLAENYENQHLMMVDIMKQCNELSLQLYSQKQEFTFDISYTLEKVKKEFSEFEKDKMPFNRIVGNLDIEIDRYARLIESLRRLPPELDTIKGVADSLLYHNDSLNQRHLLSSSQLELTMEAATLADSITMPFVLDSIGQQDRDSCIFYAKELLKMYFESKAIIVADSIHYNETYLRLKESYDYANKYYKLLQYRIFREGQTPWPTILYNFDWYWAKAKHDIKNKYNIVEIWTSIDVSSDDNRIDSVVRQVDSIDSTMTAPQVADTLILAQSSNEKPTSLDSGNVSDDYSKQVLIELFLIVLFLLAWLVSRILLIPVFTFVKPVKRNVSKQQKPYLALLLGSVLFTVFITGVTRDNTIFSKALSLSNTFIWLLAAIITALLIRLDPNQLKKGIKLYCPLIFTAFVVIGCRVLFIPNSLMNITFPPFLIIFFLWQLLVCIRHAKKADQSDRVFSWISLSVTGIAMVIAVMGYIFASLMILVWWYFQLAAILTMITIWHLTVNYKEKWMNPRISEYLNNITTVTGQDKKSYLFKVTWFYELIKDVVLPVMALNTFPLCLHLAMNVFDFDDLYTNLFNNPFIQLTNDAGTNTFRVSLHSIILLVSLFFIFRYISRAAHAIWQQSRYAQFLRKTQRTTIHKDEVNLSLGNSIINVIVWIIYAFVVVLTLNIPTGSLSLVAGGFSAGIGLALKDIINNFIYGIQLMSGRLKVGDWIECDGVRGRVTDINYQTTQVETLNNTTVSFLNSSLFAQSFTNLTKSNSYEFLKIIVGVAYGTDVQRVRNVIEEAMKVMCTKDDLGRDIVDPKYGVYVRFGEFNNSSVDIAVKQYVLVSERIAYMDRAKEVIYNALNENGINIPFPQCDVHLVKDEEPSLISSPK